MNNLNFKDYAEVVENNEVVVLDFYATWCGPCKVVGPIFDEVSNENEGQYFAKVNVDDEPELSQRFGIRSIPTILFIKGGEVQGKLIGMTTKEKIEEQLNNLI
jgi:thioredoxin 1